MITQKVKDTILKFQRNEITEHIVYQKLAEKSNEKNAEILKRISNDELHHYTEWMKYTNTEVKPDRLSILKYMFISVIFGLSFTIKIMEGGEEKAQKVYQQIFSVIPEAREIFQDEKRHEHLLIDMIDEKRLNYISSMIQGLNDALIELAGELAGFTFAFQDTRLIGFAGLIAGIAQFLSSSASELEIYISSKNEENLELLKTSFYEGLVYLFTVLLLLIPFFTNIDYYTALAITVSSSFLIIVVFTFYVSVVKSVSFKSMFLTVFLITSVVGALSFSIGWIATKVLNLRARSNSSNQIQSNELPDLTNVYALKKAHKILFITQSSL